MGVHKGGWPERVDAANGGSDDGGMEARLAKVEAAVEFVQREITELRTDVRELRGDMKLMLGAVIGAALGLAGVMAKGFGWL